MFHFQAEVIKRRKIKKSTVFFGLISLVLLISALLNFFQLGRVPFLEDFVHQIGISAYMNWIYLAATAFLVAMIIPAFRTLFQKKTVVGGNVSFDQQMLKIITGTDRYEIPEEKINEIEFELMPLSKAKNKLGGSWMKIPTKKGVLKYELNINSEEQQEQLMDMVKFLKIKHDVEVKVKELK